MPRELHVQYQPILDLASTSMRVVGYEALVRADTLTPRELFACAASDGRESELDLECLRLAVEGAQGLRLGQRLFLNLRPATVRALLRGELCFCPPKPHPPLVFELPEEPGWPEDDGVDWALLRALLGRHGEVALDDVGEGFQDLRRLRLLRPDWIKVGRGLISRLDRDTEGRAIVRYLAVLAGDLGARLVAEGIETVEEWHCCREAGVAFGQGFLFSPPRPAEEVMPR